MSSLNIVVIGGGAAGFFGAITAAETFPHATVTILEKNRTVLNKVRISGGGRCNVTHACFDNRQLVKHYPRGEKPLRSLLNQFDATATVQWFEKRGCALKTEADGRMFPGDKHLRHHCRLPAHNCPAAGHSGTHQLWCCRNPPNESNGAGNCIYLPVKHSAADRVLIATGGYPQPASYDWLPNQTESLLVASTLAVHIQCARQSIVATGGRVGAGCEGVCGGYQTGTARSVLITHWGFSGPAILRLSAWAARELADYRLSVYASRELDSRPSMKMSYERLTGFPAAKRPQAGSFAKSVWTSGPALAGAGRKSGITTRSAGPICPPNP